MFYENTNGSLDAGIMTGIVFFDVFEVGKAETIDRNLLGFGSREGGIGEYLNLDFPKIIIGFCGSGASKPDFLAVHVDTIVGTIFANLENSRGFGGTVLAHNAFLSTV